MSIISRMGRVGWTLAGAALATMFWLLVRTVAVDDGSWTLRVVEMRSPAGPDISAEPRLSSSGTRALLSWIERDGEHASLKFSEHFPSGWGTPHVVASGDNWFLNWADVPSVIRLA